MAWLSTSIGRAYGRLAGEDKFITTGGHCRVDHPGVLESQLLNPPNQFFRLHVFVRITANPIDYVVIEIHPAFLLARITAGDEEFGQINDGIKESNEESSDHRRDPNVGPLDDFPHTARPMMRIKRQDEVSIGTDQRRRVPDATPHVPGMMKHSPGMNDVIGLSTSFASEAT